MKVPCIVSEVGINANGNVEIAKQLMKISKDNDIDLVKFQKRDINATYSQAELEKPRESPWGTTTREQKMGLEFGKKEYDEIEKYSKEIDIPWFVSVWDLPSLEFIKQYKPEYIKIPSALLTHLELVTEIAKYNKYTFISTGMSTIEEIGKVVNIFREYDCSFELMHCCSAYPCPDEDLNLLVIETLKRIFNCKVGYSAHSPGIMDAVLAVALGATSIEKHITLNRTMYGSDQASSLEPHGLEKMMEYIRFSQVALGSGNKVVTQKELESLKKLRRTNDLVLR